MLHSESSSLERRNSEDTMHRQSSRSAANLDAIDCLVNTSDLALETEVLHHEPKAQRRSDSSRRDPPPLKRSRETLNRRSPPLVTGKRYPTSTSQSSSRSHHRHYPSQRNSRVSSPSPSPPPPPTSSRYRRSSRPIATVAIKRPHSHSRSPSERRHPTHRSRPFPTDTTVPISASTSEDQSLSRKTERPSPSRETGDLSFISEDESTKPTDVRSTRSAATHEPSPSTTNEKLHSTPSVAAARANGPESVLEMSQIAPDYDISLFPNSYLSASQANISSTVPMSNSNDLFLAMDLISKYKAMQSLPSADPQITACEKEIMKIIQKKIELQKLEVDLCERTLKLRDQELQERERRVQPPLVERVSTPTLPQPSSAAIEPVKDEAKIPQEQPMDTAPVEEPKQVPQAEESVPKPNTTPTDSVHDNAASKTGQEQTSTTRKNGNKSRFSRAYVDPSIFPARQTPAIDLYADDLDDSQSSPLANNAGKKVPIPKILAPGESAISLADAELKVTSSNSCRTVEFQSGHPEKTASSKGLANDLRYTLSKNRSKPAENADADDGDDGDGVGIDTKGSQLVSSDEDQTMTISKTMTSKSQSNKDDKQQSYDYHSQRSVTSSSSNDPIIDPSQDKRDHRRRPPPPSQQPRHSSSRQPYQQYPGYNSSSTASSSSADRSYPHASGSSQSKYGSNQKRYENNDLRSQLFDQKHSKPPPRAAHRNNY